jgi:signal peptidase I
MKIRVVGLSVLGTAVLVAGGLALFALDFPRIKNNDMAPGLQTGDLLLACRVCGEPKRGDVVMFAPNSEESDEPLSFRRIIGVPGDRVEVQKGRVLINGKPLEDYKQDPIELTDVAAEGPKKLEVAVEIAGLHRYRVVRDVKVAPVGDRPADTLQGYFLLADRRTFAKDSRSYGPVSKGRIRSIVKRVLSSGDHDVSRQTWLP